MHTFSVNFYRNFLRLTEIDRNLDVALDLEKSILDIIVFFIIILFDGTYASKGCHFSIYLSVLS